MPSSRCVVQGCSNTSDPGNGISLHNPPNNKILSGKWKTFAKTQRANFNAENRFVVCSEHFEETCFSRSIHLKTCRQFEKKRQMSQPMSIVKETVEGTAVRLVLFHFAAIFLLINFSKL